MSHAKEEDTNSSAEPAFKGSIIFHAALSATTNQLTWLYGDAKDTAGMIDLVELLFNQYHDKSRLYITWDAASWHSSNQLVEWVDELNAGSWHRKWPNH